MFDPHRLSSVPVWISVLCSAVFAVLSAAPAMQTPTNDLGFQPPAGYVTQRNGDVILLVPGAASRDTPCIYGLGGRQPSSGNFETDAAAALFKNVADGWRRIDDRHSAMRGTSAAGWRYVWYRAAFQGLFGGQPQPVNAMAMVLPAGANQVHVVWGVGTLAHCLLEDASFEQLFHSLQPSGWKADGGQALTKSMQATWRYTAGAGIQQFTFKPGNRYDRDLGSSAQVGVSNRTSATATSGTFAVRDGELFLTPDHRPTTPDRYFVRVYDESYQGSWKPSMALFDARAKPPLVMQYYRVESSPRQ